MQVVEKDEGVMMNETQREQIGIVKRKGKLESFFCVSVVIIGITILLSSIMFFSDYIFNTLSIIIGPIVILIALIAIIIFIYNTIKNYKKYGIIFSFVILFIAIIECISFISNTTLSIIKIISNFLNIHS